MPTELAVPRHLEGLRAAMLAFVRYAERAGLEVPVPTCPDWTVRRLIGHQGMVHRWAAASLKGRRLDNVDAIEKQGRSASDPVDWLRDGAIEIVQAIVEAPEDVRTIVFLNDAPGPRAFWARRQCHETTIHAVDALSAALGRYPVASDAWIDDDLAVDGIDELVGGFITRNQSRLRSADPLTILVAPDGVDRPWLVEVSESPAVTTRGPADLAASSADVTVTGSPVAVYLSLWNRSDEAEVSGGDWDLWRTGAAITM